ncbi:response regulator [Aquipuribacter nitratireducens]|uniref:Response regulator n=1 Tax=Aquipuribacter nitratireducens TaxID=650104 RepID=A0ABW0GKU7_9MICO
MTRGRVLVVEDNRLNRKLVRDVLVHSGFDVVEAATGEDGVRVCRDTHPDVVLMDLQLPGIDGTEALRLLRTQPGGDVPVVAVTASVMASDRAAVAAAGFDGFLEKPLDVRRLPEQVGDLVAHGRLT